jgi:hypothetical protein
MSQNCFPNLNSVNNEQYFTPPDDIKCKYTVVNFDFMKAKWINKAYYATLTSLRFGNMEGTSQIFMQLTADMNNAEYCKKVSF